MPKRELDYAVSSGNVFADLGLPNPEELLAKAELAHKITVLIQQRGLTQAQAAKLLGVDQPKISSLIRGPLTGFSIERLMRFLLRLGQTFRSASKQLPAIAPKPASLWSSYPHQRAAGSSRSCRNSSDSRSPSASVAMPRVLPAARVRRSSASHSGSAAM